jgi:predicted histone-like DNA-binding protein
MVFKYHLVEKVNPLRKDEPKKFYAKATHSRELTVRELAQNLERTTSLSTADMVGVFEGLLSIVPAHLIEGKIIRLGDFGSLSLEVSSQGTEKAEEFTAHQIRRVKINFRPGKILKDAIKSLRYEKEAVKTSAK